jgi:hypothetical protein
MVVGAVFFIIPSTENSSKAVNTLRDNSNDSYVTETVNMENQPLVSDKFVFKSSFINSDADKQTDKEFDTELEDVEQSDIINVDETTENISLDNIDTLPEEELAQLISLEEEIPEDVYYGDYEQMLNDFTN